jgi:hypothetical protein
LRGRLGLRWGAWLSASPAKARTGRISNALSGRTGEGPVEWLGCLPRPALAAAYAESDALLVTSVRESGPIVVWEAMAARSAARRLVAVRGSGLESALVDGVNCLLFDVCDTDGAARRSRRLANDPALADQLRRNAFDLVQRPLLARRVRIGLGQRFRRVLDLPPLPTPPPLPPAPAPGRLDRWLGPAWAESLRALRGQAAAPTLAASGLTAVCAFRLRKRPRLWPHCELDRSVPAEDLKGAGEDERRVAGGACCPQAHAFLARLAGERSCARRWSRIAAAGVYDVVYFYNPQRPRRGSSAATPTRDRLLCAEPLNRTLPLRSSAHALCDSTSLQEGKAPTDFAGRFSPSSAPSTDDQVRLEFDKSMARPAWPQLLPHRVA